MTPPHAQPVSAGRLRDDVAAGGEPAGPFVINLCSSTTPMALSQPQDPELKRFTFFVSRRQEDGRERFRLHMGYFETLQEAEEWVAVTREFYPGAWAGEAPGKRLRSRAVAAASAQVVSAAADAPAVASTGAAPVVAAALVPAIAALRSLSVPPVDVPVLHAAPEAAAVAPEPMVLQLLEVPPRQSPVQAQAAIAPGPAESAPAKPTVKPRPALGLSNVREVLASLEETEVTREMPALKAPRVERPDSARALSDTQVLKLLEQRRSDGKRAQPDSNISMLKPDDTGTRRALQDAVAANAPVSFAVQLQWSVQRIDVAKVPPLAIFGAYTLYTVEGSREGRRWYGLRLGFFSDAVSAKQVAHYVRSEFNSVAVVPVSPQERSRACETDAGNGKSAGAAATQPSKSAGAKSPVRDRLPEPTSEFKLLDDEPQAAAMPCVPEQQAPTPKRSVASPGKRAGRASAVRVRARDKRMPQTLEETLEILGADQLEIDDKHHRGVESSSGAQPKAPVRRSSPFTKLLDRLAERSRRDR